MLARVKKKKKKRSIFGFWLFGYVHLLDNQTEAWVPTLPEVGVCASSLTKNKRQLHISYISQLPSHSPSFGSDSAPSPVDVEGITLSRTPTDAEKQQNVALHKRCSRWPASLRPVCIRKVKSLACCVNLAALYSAWIPARALPVNTLPPTGCLSVIQGQMSVLSRQNLWQTWNNMALASEVFSLWCPPPPTATAASPGSQLVTHWTKWHKYILVMDWTSLPENLAGWATAWDVSNEHF